MSKFGSPDHDSIWFEDKSLRHPNGAHFDNLRNEIKSWRENALSNGIYPCFTSCASGLTTDSEEDIGSIIEVSDLEPETEDEVDDSPGVWNYYTNNKRRLETLWKLYRNVGETVEDINNRLARSQPKNKSVTCSESDNNNQNDSFNGENLQIKCIKKKSEYSDCEKINVSTDSNVTAEQLDTKPNKIFIKSKKEKSDYESDNNDFSNSNIFDGVLDVQLHEPNENIQPSDIHEDNDTKGWSFKSSIRHNSRNSESLVDTTPNCTYDVPRLKQITNEELISKKKTNSRKRLLQQLTSRKKNP